MKKFSKLILETKNEIRKMSALTNPVDWDEIFKPLIEHIENNLQSDSKGPGNSVFTDRTKSLLDQFITQVEEDYNSYFRYEIHDGSQEGFLSAYNINVDYRDIMDCIQPLLDRADYVEDSGNFDYGAFSIDISSIRYNTNEEIVEDLLDVHGKLKMLDADFTIIVTKSKGGRETRTISLTKKLTDVNDVFGIMEGEKISYVLIYIYNKETVHSSFLLY